MKPTLDPTLPRYGTDLIQVQSTKSKVQNTRHKAHAIRNLKSPLLLLPIQAYVHRNSFRSQENHQLAEDRLCAESQSHAKRTGASGKMDPTRPLSTDPSRG